MRWTSMELAALATRAVPGLSPTGAADAPDDARDFMAAVVVDGSGNRWRVRGPQHAQAAMRLETEVQVLRGFSTAVRAELPFRVPSVAGATRVGDMRVFVYNHLPGQTVELKDLVGASEELRQSIGRTVAAVHDLDDSVVDHANLPRYNAERIRQRRLNELDAAAATGRVPAVLLRRWEHAMEDRDLWNFQPSVVHGDLHEDNLLIEGDRVIAVTGWTDLHVGDPADDLAWLVASPDQPFADAVWEAYRSHRRHQVDEHIARRAALSAEFALAQWLVRGRSSDNSQMVEEATALLTQLASDVDTYGGRPIAVTPMEGESEDTPAEWQDSKPVARAGAAATVAGAGAWTEDDDAEPAVITDADAEPADDPAAGAPVAESAQSADETQTAAIPPYVEHHFGEDDTPTESFAPVPAEPAYARADDDELPIQPAASAERRAKQKKFFPVSASSARSAASARSADSAHSAASAETASAEQVTSPDASAESAASSARSPAVPAQESSADTAGHDDGSIYDRHPGLRPPGS